MVVKIGVLGGIGPEATSQFYSRLIEKLQERGLIKSNKDYPQIVINSIPAPELIYDKISEKDLETYISGLKELEKFKVDFIVIVCNTIHLFYDRLQEEVKTQIIDLRKELEKTLIKNKIKSTLVIGTPNTLKRGLYRFKGIKSLEPNEEEMTILTNAIFNFNKGSSKAIQIQKVKEICQKYLKEGAETIILGCTELAIMLSKENFPKIDTIEVLVEATVNKFLSQKVGA